jgi:hypothetical protein
MLTNHHPEQLNTSDLAGDAIEAGLFELRQVLHAD